MPTPSERRERFIEKFGLPVGDGATVKLTEGGDTMLIGYSELLSFLEDEVERAEKKRDEEWREKVKGYLWKSNQDASGLVRQHNQNLLALLSPQEDITK